MKDLELELNHNAVCPYCGYEELSSWELNMGDGDKEIIVCEECNKEFEVNCVIDVTYSTKKQGVHE